MFTVELTNALSENGRVEYVSHNNLKIAFWGVLYNKKELGFDVADAESSVACSIYERYGALGFSKLDGSFTFILVDGSQTMVVRDHHGTNLQVYYNDKYCASSLKLLQQTEGCSSTPDYRALGTFLTMGYIATPGSSFENIHKLPAGSMLVCNGAKRHVHNLFDTSHIEPACGSGDLEFISNKYGQLHGQAIAKRIGSSRNVGILLSGGYDSGCNLAGLRKIYDGDIRSYSIGFKDDDWSELPLARCMSETFGTIHEQYEIDGSEIAALPDIVDELGDPFVEGGLMVNYTAMKMIGANKPDVILGGDGSDQYFGTSAREVALHYLASKYGVKPVLSALCSMLNREKFDKNTKLYRVRFHLEKVLNILQGDVFGFPRFKLQTLLADSSFMPDLVSPKPDTSSFGSLYVQHTYQTDIERIINQVILFKASRMAAMFDNKIAFPYMDNELYKFLIHLPLEYKCRANSLNDIAKGNVTSKFLLKYHYKPILPEQITSKKKQGGFAPMPIFFKDAAGRARIADFILSSSVVGNFLNREQVEKFIRNYDNEVDQVGNWFWYKQSSALQYFNLLTLAIWWEKYVKRSSEKIIL